MINEERFLELSNRSRTAWSARPVWDRRPPMGGRRHRPAHLGHTAVDNARRSRHLSRIDSIHPLVQSKSPVANRDANRGAP